MLASFEVEGFRTFKHLRIDRLARVNLVVGRNNVGKTMLLEALRFYVSGELAHLARLLREREELLPGGGEGGGVVHLGALAHGRPTSSGVKAIQLRELGAPERGIVLGINVTQARIDAKRGSAGRPWEASAYGFSNGGTLPGRPAFVPLAQGISELWDAVVLQGGEDRVIQCLQILAPVERITLIVQAGRRVAMARVAGRAQPVPLRSLGDGVLRAFQLALAIELSLAESESPLPDTALDEPMLLVDEIETGIHYSVLPDVWRFVFRAARERGVQVFATTHSWDCIEAFQQAAAGEPGGSAALIRLEHKGDEHRAVHFEQDELPIVTKSHIEVR